MEVEEHRDWAGLLPELVKKIGDALLSDDVAEYIRMRAVCWPWRSATTGANGDGDPRLLLPRFFPRSWQLLVPGEKLRTDGAPERFVNVRTGAVLHIRLPTPGEYRHHGSAEGLLILSDPATDSLCLLNPLTLTFTDLPSLCAMADAVEFPAGFAAADIRAAGVVVDAAAAAAEQPLQEDNVHLVLILTDDGVVAETVAAGSEQPRGARPPPPAPAYVHVVISLTAGTRTVLVCARPGEFAWRAVDTSCADELEGKLPTIKRGLAFWGGFYVPTRGGDVLRVVLQPQPHLEFVARQTGSSVCSGLSESSFLVPFPSGRKDGMLLVRKKRGVRQRFLTWDVDLENGRLVRVKKLRDMTVMLPSVAVCSSSFPTILQNRVCSKNYMRWFLSYIHLALI